jgi:hypothetical protein
MSISELFRSEGDAEGQGLQRETGSVREKEKVSRTYSPVQPHKIFVQPYEILAMCFRSMLKRYEKLDEIERGRRSKIGGETR